VSEVVLEAAWPVPADDPYPVLAQLRQERPVHYIEGLDCHLVVAHREAHAVLSGSSWSADPRTNEAIAYRLNTSGGGDLLTKSVLFSDPPEHQRLRRALSGHLSPRATDSMRPRIKSVVDAAFGDLPDMDSFDVMKSLAYPVPLAVICELLNVGVDMAHAIRNETSKMTAMLDPLAAPSEVEEGVGAAFGLMLQLVPLVAQRRTSPGDDLLSALVSSSGGQPRLEADEAIMMALLLLAAGQETTANLIANAVVCLDQYPHVARALRRNPELLARATEELSRYESPVQLTSRVTKNNIRLSEVEFEAGAQVLVSIGGANRDPVAFEDPDRLDFSRVGGGHLAFGHGAHFCAGASLARVEVQEVLTRLLSLDPPLEDREVTAQRGTSHTFRNFDTLVVTRR
jgi:cytochrome P450